MKTPRSRTLAAVSLAALLAALLALILPGPRPVLAAQPNCRVLGEVVDQAGHGLINVRVTIWVNYEDWAGRARFASASTTTDAGGNYGVDLTLAGAVWVVDASGDFWTDGLIQVGSLSKTNYDATIYGEPEFDGIGELPIGNLMTPCVMAKRK